MVGYQTCHHGEWNEQHHRQHCVQRAVKNLSFVRENSINKKTLVSDTEGGGLPNEDLPRMKHRPVDMTCQLERERGVIK